MSDSWRFVHGRADRARAVRAYQGVENIPIAALLQKVQTLTVG